MPTVSEQISKEQAKVQGKTDANISNDANHLGGIPANDYATKKYVQDFHNAKDIEQKEYIDKQDEEMLRVAKEYTNSQIRNQDFSGFAELKDINALKENLERKITDGDNTQKTYADTKIKQVVDDTNANFKDVETSITTLNNNVNDLFQSVSSGKTKIAGAITDKGVVTSANDTFDTMAGNIRKITTGGGSTDPNYVNTADANADANDIKVGKSAYVKGQKVYGTLIAQAEPGMPTYGLDTSDATAVESDIAYGKTAYARGQKIIGSMTNNKVEEILGLKTDNFNFKNFLRYFDKDPITNEDVESKKIIYSKDLSYCIVIRDTCLESYPINKDGIYIVGSIGIDGKENIKKYRYAKSELGITEEESFVEVSIGSGGVDGDPKKCYAYIITSQKITNEEYIYNLYIKTYHLRENGVIGKEYENENVVDIKKKIEENRQINFHIIPCNLDISRFVILPSYVLPRTPIISGKITNNHLNTYIYNNLLFSENEISAYDISNDDKYIYAKKDFGSTNSDSIIIIIDKDYNLNITENGVPVPSFYDAKSQTFSSITNNTLSIFKEENKKIQIIKRIILENNNTNLTYSSYVFINSNFIFTLSPQKGMSYGSFKTIARIFLKDINNIPDGSTITPDYEKDILSISDDNTVFYNDIKIIPNINNQRILFLYYESKNLQENIQLNLETDPNNIVAVKYKDKYFYTLESSNLSALPNDVKKEKTFIGEKGTPETGTLEV